MQLIEIVSMIKTAKKGQMNNVKNKLLVKYYECKNHT